MCGFLGIASNNINSNSEDFYLNLNKLICRGPDEQKIKKVSENILIGFNRLSIVDSINGSQPISNSDNSIWLMMNGEIYNYKKLKSKITNLYNFKTESDSEVAMALYEIYGIEFVNMLSGMYAIIIVDLNISKIYMFRDKFGEKPLYYKHDGNKFIFGSTLDAVLNSKIEKKEINLFAIQEYLRYNYFPSQNLIMDVNSVKPNVIYQYDVRNNNLEKSKIKNSTSIDPESNAIQPIKYLKKLLLESVEESLIGDRLPGLLLSSGVDSTLIANLLFELNYDSTFFNLDFKNKNYTEFNEIKFPPQNNQIFRNLHRVEFDYDKLPTIDYLVRQMGEPLGDSSVLAIWAITDYLKRCNFKAALTGDGGDELLRGYKSYDATRLHYILTSNKFLSKHLKASDLSKYIKNSDKKVGFSTKLKRFLYGLQFDTNQCHPIWIHSWNEKEIKKILMLDELTLPIEVTEKYSNLEEILHYCQRFDINNYLQKDILVKADRGSMINSIELRAPLSNMEKRLFLN
jgi:asparagine synthase (glutamine-hydrolysing)